MHIVVKILLLTALLANFAEGLYTPLYAAYVEEVGGGVLDAGLSWSVNLIVSGVLAVVLSHVQVRSGRKLWYLVAGYLLSALSSILFAVACTPGMLYVIQFIRGLSWAMISPVWAPSLPSTLIEGGQPSSGGTMRGAGP